MFNFPLIKDYFDKYVFDDILAMAILVYTYFTVISLFNYLFILNQNVSAKLL